MKRRQKTEADAPGQDSFLDIVANLVGILLILIMVVGARTTDAIVVASQQNSSKEAPALDAEAPRRAAKQVEEDIHQIADKLKRQEIETEYRRMERDKIQTLVAAAEQELDAHRAELDTQQQAEFDLQNQLAAAHQQLEQFQQQQQSLKRAIATPNTIEHLPTPMAKTVFGREAHFRLQHGRLAYVPWDELVERLKNEAPQKAWKLKESPRITETLGPIDGFRMKYTLQRTNFTINTNSGPRSQSQVELEKFVLVPVADRMGERLVEALKDHSEFRQRLAEQQPDRTTVVVWVYPDSFDEFRQLKQELFRLGYLTAGRPLPEDHPIGGSPNGTRSAAE